MAYLADVHCHLDHPNIYHHLDEILSRAKQAGVKAIVNAGVNEKSNQISLDISRKYPLVLAGLGLFPGDIKSEQDIVRVKEQILANKEHVRAIAEIGLDGSPGYPPIYLQRLAFLELLTFAKHLGVCAIVHTRKAEEECVDTVLKFGYKKVIFHCFSGSLRLAKQIADAGCYLSLPPSITYTTHFRRMVEEIPSTRLVAETDSPYLPPVRGEINEPMNVAVVVREFSALKKVTYEEAEKMFFQNVQHLFSPLP